MTARAAVVFPGDSPRRFGTLTTGRAESTQGLPVLVFDGEKAACWPSDLTPGTVLEVQHDSPLVELARTAGFDVRATMPGKPEDRVDDYLTRKAASLGGAARVVVRYVERWSLERDGAQPVELGASFADARAAVKDLVEGRPIQPRRRRSSWAERS